jgi:hypothetical protein
MVIPAQYFDAETADTRRCDHRKRGDEHCKACERMEKLQPIMAAHWCDADPDFGLTYQKCRFCGVSWPKVKGLFKYAVRHYVCADCRNKKMGQYANLLMNHGRV